MSRRSRIFFASNQKRESEVSAEEAVIASEESADASRAFDGARDNGHSGFGDDITLDDGPDGSDERSDKATGGEHGSLSFGGIDPFRHWFFSSFFRTLLRNGYSEENPAQEEISLSASKAVTTGWIYMIIRKAVFLFALAIVAVSSLDGMVFKSSGAEFVANIPVTGSPVGVFLMLSAVGVIVSLGFSAGIGRIFDFMIGERREKLINFVTGQCGELAQEAHKCFRAIYSEYADYPTDSAHQSEWPKKAKAYFLSGHRHAKRLQFLEVFVLIETRRVVTHFRIIDVVSILLNVVIVAALLGFLYFNSNSLTVPFWMAAASAVVIGGIWTFWGSRSDDTFSHGVLEAVIEGYHSFAKFSLEEEIGDIIRRDQVKIIELTGKLARR